MKNHGGEGGGLPGWGLWCRPRRSRLLLGVLGGLYLLASIGGTLWQKHTLESELLLYRAEEQNLRQEQQMLSRQLQLMQTPVYVERLAREKLGMVRPGEKILVPARPGQIAPWRPLDPEDIRD